MLQDCLSMIRRYGLLCTWCACSSKISGLKACDLAHHMSFICFKALVLCHQTNMNHKHKKFVYGQNQVHSLVIHKSHNTSSIPLSSLRSANNLRSLFLFATRTLMMSEGFFCFATNSCTNIMVSVNLDLPLQILIFKTQLHLRRTFYTNSRSNCQSHSMSMWYKKNNLHTWKASIWIVLLDSCMWIFIQKLNFIPYAILNQFWQSQTLRDIIIQEIK